MNRLFAGLGTFGTLTIILLVGAVAWNAWHDSAASQPGPPPRQSRRLQQRQPPEPEPPGQQQPPRQQWPPQQQPPVQYQPPRQSPPPPPGAPQVIHIHHHYSNLSSPATEMSSAFAPGYAWNYGFQPGMGNVVRPWTQNWGHLGFTGYLGMQSGRTGLVVDKLTPDSPAAKMGLVSGDFILAINGQPVSDYKQVTILFDETVDKPKAPLSLKVWNPTTGRTMNLQTELVTDE